MTTDGLFALADPHRDPDLASTVAVVIPAGGATLHAIGTPRYTHRTDRVTPGGLHIQGPPTICAVGTADPATVDRRN